MRSQIATVKVPHCKCPYKFDIQIRAFTEDPSQMNELTKSESLRAIFAEETTQATGEWVGSDLSQLTELLYETSHHRETSNSHYTEIQSAALIFVELTNSAALRHEGQSLRHCVATYASLCIHRRSAIWSLRRQSEIGRAHV